MIAVILLFAKRKVLLTFAVVLFSWFVYGQTNDAVRKQSEFSHRTSTGLSQLAEENLSRVAASAVQIREVLIRDVGLQVELKRWVAKEAADNGRVVEDSDLTDQAIFDRLDRDVVFRSVATRLLQRYGYLLPTTNPDSTAGKQEDLVLKERARRLVQIEAQEDSESLKPENSETQLQRTSSCGTEGAECANPRFRKQQQRELDGGEPVQNEAPIPRETPQLAPEMPKTLRTQLSTDALTPRDVTADPQFGLSSASLQTRDGNQFSSTVDGATAPEESSSRGNAFRYSATTGSQEMVASNDMSRRSTRTDWKRTQSQQHEEDFSPVKMLRTANPYSDVPSLYDMYVQAAARQRAPERFGVEVFRNTASQTDVIPMDLPVGPDYVVGPGDNLAIDLWGSVSQRMMRPVSREGRIALPETAPLLVSGKSLGEIQLDVQHALRGVYRDVFADVSISRLRTVRVYVVGDVVEPGAYDISSLSTPLNALFSAGGVTPRGSLRALRHFRGSQLIEQVDAYDLLLHGIRSDLKRLENGDTLQVPPMGRQVTVDGMVRRPAIYELSGEKSLAEVLQLAGGILPTAALRHIEVQRIEAHEKRTMLTLDLASSEPKEIDEQLQAFQIQDGDQVHIFPIATYNQDAIYLEGHVLRPGRYSYKPGMKLTELISSYTDLLPEPALHYAEIIRLNPPDFHPSVESFDISSAL